MGAGSPAGGAEQLTARQWKGVQGVTRCPARSQCLTQVVALHASSPSHSCEHSAGHVPQVSVAAHACVAAWWGHELQRLGARSGRGHLGSLPSGFCLPAMRAQALRARSTAAPQRRVHASRAQYPVHRRPAALRWQAAPARQAPACRAPARAPRRCTQGQLQRPLRRAQQQCRA